MLTNSIANYDFLTDSHVSNQMMTLENLQTPGFTFTSYASIEHFVTLEDDNVIIRAATKDTNPKILVSDIQANDGVVHKIDKMLGNILVFIFK